MEQDELGIDGMKEFKSKIKFLDIVINHYASEQNPHRKGLFLGFVKRQGVNCLEMTDIRGESKWYQVFDKHSKLEIAENFVNVKVLCARFNGAKHVL